MHEQAGIGFSAICAEYQRRMTLRGNLCQFLAAQVVRAQAVLSLLGARCLKGVAVVLVLLLSSTPVVLAQQESDPVTDSAHSPLSNEIEDLKQAALALNRDLLILEEELLFPANTQVMVFLSVDVGEYFRLDAVKLHIDDQLVASHLYTPRQNDALKRGGIQRLYIGNLKSGEHELTAFFTGIGPGKREYKRGATVTIEKDDNPKMLELQVMDSTANMQPEFDFKEWQP